MIREDRVIEETKLACADVSDKTALQHKSSYFKTDYISKETLKSFVSGTFCFLVILVIWGMWNMTDLVEQINLLDYVGIGTTIVKYYIVFIVIYLLITFIVYYLRWQKDEKRMESYQAHLKTLKKIYSREDNLKL